MIDKNKSPASNEEWKAWGKLDPLYGVAAIPGHAKNGSNPWIDQTFYELGAIDWKLFSSRWEQYGLLPGRCVEIGCGAGRMTAHLARYFQTVYGLDVSSGMIEYAREHVPSNVFLYVTDGVHIPLEGCSVDAVFSSHVLQHLATTQAAASYFKEMHRVLVGGGSIMIHVLILAWPWGSFLSAHKLIHVGKSLWDAFLAQLRRYAFRCGLALAPPMQMIWYETTWLYEKLNELGFEDIEIRILFGGSKMAVQHPFLFARKKLSCAAKIPAHNRQPRPISLCGNR